MARFPQPEGRRGSLRWIQRLVNDHPDVLDQALGCGQIEWRSPLREDDFAEYRDAAFLERLGVRAPLPKEPLESFWPPRGPQWDALGLAGDGRLVLVEAKAHVRELFSPPSKASGRSLETIARALARVRSELGASRGVDWTERFYQYANRLAHAHFLGSVNGLPTVLAFVHFVGDEDMQGPRTRREWEAALMVLHEALGLTGRVPSFVREVFIDVSREPPAVA